MAYVRARRMPRGRRGDRLGLFGVDDAIIIGAGVKAAPMLAKLFGGNADEKRKARVDYMAQAARRGSVLAAQIILGAQANVAGNEDPMWAAAQQQIPGGVLAEALAQGGGWWPTGQPFEMPNQISQIEQELQSIEGGAYRPGGLEASDTSSGGSSLASLFGRPASTNTGTPGAHTLAGMTTTAPYNFSPLLIGGGLLLVGLMLSKRS